jgi:hypothetical protein
MMTCVTLAKKIDIKNMEIRSTTAIHMGVGPSVWGPPLCEGAVVPIMCK